MLDGRGLEAWPGCASSSSWSWSHADADEGDSKRHQRLVPIWFFFIYVWTTPWLTSWHNHDNISDYDFDDTGYKAKADDHLNNLISCCLTGSQISDTFLHVSEDLNDQTFVWLLTLCRLLLDHTYVDRSWTLEFEFCASGPSFSIDQTTPHFSIWLIIKSLLTCLLETCSCFTFLCLQKLFNPFQSQLSADCKVSLPLVVQCIVIQYFNQLAVFALGLLDSSERL